MNIPTPISPRPRADLAAAGQPVDLGAAPHAPPTQAAPRTAWAATFADMRACQRLRHAVFVVEQGAQLVLPPGAPAGHDCDAFDPHCEHLMVLARRGHAPWQQDESVVATSRLLLPQAAQALGRLYSDGEFDLGALQGLRPTLAELGRTCVHPDHRQGTVMLAMWGALGRHLQAQGVEYLIGCASVSMRDGGHAAASLWQRLSRSHAAPAGWQVQPHLPLPIGALRTDLGCEAPPLLQAYLRCGARLLGPPAWDPDFGCADLPLLIRLADMPLRYRRHFMPGSPQARDGTVLSAGG